MRAHELIERMLRMNTGNQYTTFSLLKRKKSVPRDGRSWTIISSFDLILSL